MLNQRMTFARAVAAELFPAEADLEQAIVHASRLTIALVEGRKAAKQPITMGQDGLAHMARATTKLVEARGDMGAAHEAFREAQNELGLKALSFGDYWDCPASKGEAPAEECAGGATDQPRPYRGPWPIRDHRDQFQVSRDEQAKATRSKKSIADAA
jgi:hypothetical protein